jgi:hypothetical protein
MSEKKTPSQKLAKSEKAESNLTCRDKHFSDRPKEEFSVFLQLQIMRLNSHIVIN